MVRNFITFEPSQVEWAGVLARPPRFGGRKNRPTGAQAAGIRYDRKAQEYLSELFPDTYVSAPWLVFRLRGEPMPRFCQPDGIIIDIPDSKITIVEIKLRHCAEAYIQITGIYWPVLRKIFPTFTFRHLEFTRWYDPATHFPVPVAMVSNIALAPSGRFGVHIWNE